MNKLETTLAGKKLKNPVIGASGTYGYGEDYKDFYPPDLLGGMATKGLTYHPKAGNRGIRIWETPSGLLNSIGLENPGVQEFVQETAAKLENLGTRIFVNLGGDCLQDYIQGAELLEGTDLDYIELNISCPNVKAGGMAFGMEAKSAGFITGEIKKVTNKPLIVKLSPNADSLTDVAKACEDHGADGLSLVNTFQGMAIDIEKKKPVFENVYAGLSGPAIKPIALRMVHQTVKAVTIPVIGLGGINSWQDALEFIMAGARAVQIGTGNFRNPYLGKEIIEGLNGYLDEQGLESIDQVRGIL